MKNKIFIFLSLTMVLSCHKTQQDNLLNMSDYPVKVGDKWDYQVTNYTLNQTDTALMMITAKTVFSNDSTVFNTQTSVQGTIIDSGILVMSPSSFKYVPTSESNSLFEHIELTFPINGQSTWDGTQGRDIYSVIASNQAVTIMGNTYTNVVEIARVAVDIQLFNVIDTIYICPQIGIIKLDANIISDQNKTVSLINYQLN